jgi:hypothetical protein
MDRCIRVGADCNMTALAALRVAFLTQDDLNGIIELFQLPTNTSLEDIEDTHLSAKLGYCWNNEKRMYEYLLGGLHGFVLSEKQQIEYQAEFERLKPSTQLSSRIQRNSLLFSLEEQKLLAQLIPKVEKSLAMLNSCDTEELRQSVNCNLLLRPAEES